MGFRVERTLSLDKEITSQKHLLHKNRFKNPFYPKGKNKLVELAFKLFEECQFEMEGVRSDVKG